MKKITTHLFIAVFFLLCLIPSLGMLIWGESKAGANEILANKPSITERNGGFNWDVLSDFSDYMADRFAFRQELVTGWARLNATLFHRSTAADVTIGSDGWLYFTPTLDNYTGANPLSPRELWTAARTLYLMEEYTESREGTFLFTLAPNKNSLYGENMPDYTILSETGNAENLMALLSAMEVNYADLFKAFDETGEVLYFKGDSHWNGKGAALAADVLLEALGHISPDYFGSEFTPAPPHLGDLYEMLYPAGKATEADYTPAEAFTFDYTSPSSDPDAITLTTENGSAEGNLLCYRDSFGRNLNPYLAQQFAEAHFSRKNNYDLTLMADGGHVLVELVERNIHYLNRYTPTFPAPERAQETDEATVIMAYCGSYKAENGAPEGYVKLSGDLSDLTVDAASPVYIHWGNRVFEAVPSPTGFSATLEDMGELPKNLPVTFYQNGNLVTAFAVNEE